MILSRVIEGAPLGLGFFVQKGTAENGVVKSGAGEAGYGVSIQSDELFAGAVGDHVGVALPGNVAKVLLAFAGTAGDDVAPDAAGKAVAIATGAGTKNFRGGTLLENGASGVLVDMIVHSDFVTIPV